MANRRRWTELSEATRRRIVIGVALEAILKIAALIDIVRRPADRIRGSKVKWAAAVITINSFGAVPIAYFGYGRRPRQARINGRRPYGRAARRPSR